MANMTHDLLDFAKGEAHLNMENIVAGDLIAELNQIMGDYYRDSPVKYRSVLKHPFQFTADRDKILRVLVNLLRNAKEAMSAGGEVTLMANSSGSEAILQVSDTGPGIPPEIKENLFQPFTTFGKKSGTGLGLALSKKIVEDHGGTIECVSEAGKGATFILRLPVAELKNKKNQPAAPSIHTKS